MISLIKIKNDTRMAGDIKYWFNEAGSIHREDGPAIEYPDGINRWFLNGRELTELCHFEESPYFQSLPVEERVLRRLMIR